MHLIYDEFVLALKGTMCKSGKFSVGDFPLKNHKIISIYFKSTTHIEDV
jgi:hypothetical protein